MTEDEYKTGEESPTTLTLELIAGVEGDSVYLNDYRIAGPKPWGGGRLKKKWKVRLEDIETVIKRASK